MKCDTSLRVSLASFAGRLLKQGWKDSCKEKVMASCGGVRGSVPRGVVLSSCTATFDASSTIHAAVFLSRRLPLEGERIPMIWIARASLFYQRKSTPVTSGVTVRLRARTRRWSG
jgi:hypothetical protein